MNEKTAETINTIVRPYQPGDEEGINSLFNEVFGLNRSLSEWRWKFAAGPIARPDLVAVAEDKGRIVGVYASLFHRLKFGEETLVVTFPVDNAIHPSYRGGIRGLQYKLFQEQKRLWEEEKIPLALGFPNRGAFIIGKRLLKYKLLMDLAVWHKRLTPRIGLKARIKRLPSGLENAVVFMSGLWTRIRLGAVMDSGVRIRKVLVFPPEINQFWERFQNLYPAMLVRDQTYLNWRYAPQGGQPYQIWLAWSKNEISGIAVGRLLEKAPGQERLGIILELAGLPPFNSLPSLLKSMLLWFVQQKADGAIARMSPMDPFQECYKSFGFHLRPDRFDHRLARRVFLPDKVEHGLLLDPKSWYTTLGDSDAL